MILSMETKKEEKDQGKLLSPSERQKTIGKVKVDMESEAQPMN